MATLLYSYKDSSGATKYIGATSISDAQKKAPAGSSFSQVQGFSSDKATKPSDERMAEIASQEFVTQENKEAIQKTLPTQTVYNTPQPGMVGYQPATTTTTTNTDKDLPKINIPTSDRVSSLNTFTSALQQAVNLGRKQRQDAELDFLGGVVPPGSVTASTFTGLLGNLNRASTNYSQDLVDKAVGFAQDEQALIADQQNSIRDLALSVVEAGGDQATVNGILKAGDIDSAIAMAAGALNTNDKLVVEKVGSNLVRYDPADPDNTTEVLFSADGSSGGGGGGSTVSTGGATTRTSEPQVDWLNLSTNELLTETKKALAPDIANQIATELTNEQLKLFMNDYMIGTATGEIIDIPSNYYRDWKIAAGLETAEEEETSTGSTNPFRS